MKKRGEAKLGIEGSEEGRWTLIDYGDFVVHVFSPEDRAYYALEDIWGDAPHLEWQEPPGESGARGRDRPTRRRPVRPRRRPKNGMSPHDERPRSTEGPLRRRPAGGRRPRGVREGRAPGDRPQVRRLPGQRLHGAGQVDRQEAPRPRRRVRRRRGPRPDRRPARGRRARLPQRPPRRRLDRLGSRRPAGRRSPRPGPAGQGEDGRHRLLVAERRQADARRAPAVHRHRRQPGAVSSRPPGTRSSATTTSATGARSSA